MISALTIDRFKSIRSLSIPCRRVNVFIGEPDTGKTNISRSARRGFDQLFYRQFFDAPIQIVMRRTPSTKSDQPAEFVVSASVTAADRRLQIHVQPPGSGAEVGFNGNPRFSTLEWIRCYTYESSESWRYDPGPYDGRIVTPPSGHNLLYVARHNARIYEFLKTTVAGLDCKLRFDQAQRTFRLSEVRRDEIIDYNLDLLSDSLKRLFFYGSVILASEDATLVLDEPDVFAFPPYPKTLGEMVGSDTSNQFFLTTHNPYFLAGIVEKTSAEDLALFVCRRDEDGSTRAEQLDRSDLERVIELGPNVFFNLDQFGAK